MGLEKWLSHYHGRKLWVRQRETDWEIWIEDPVIVENEAGETLAEFEGPPGRSGNYRSKESAQRDLTAWALNTHNSAESTPTDEPVWINVNAD